MLLPVYEIKGARKAAKASEDDADAAPLLDRTDASEEADA